MSWKRISAAWRRGGPRLALAVAGDRVHDYWWEKRFGVQATGLIPIETLVVDWQGFHDYFPSGVRTFHRLMEHVDVRPGKDVFLDLGSGKGRALLMAARYPFKRILGVEVSAALGQVARRNLAHWSGRLACRDIVVCTGDAACFPIPDDATVFYLYNPFHGPTLRAVFEAIERSRSRAPRRVWVLFNNTTHFRAVERDFSWLRPLARPAFEHECGVYLGEP
ncbi:MAG TPA: class I SAM-dependent methyltransferase [Reyranella sp.]|jgi:SAM-dependent methyltransferase|nr:class I SAM-dependent methyltransferase [Reyranella sp.]